MRAIALCAALALCLIGCGEAAQNRRWSAKAGNMPILTGAQIVGHGFNARDGTQGLFPIQDFTYQFNNTWISPVSGVSYAVPDQLNLASIPESMTRIVQTISSTFTDAFDEYTSWFKFSIGINYQAFSASFNYDHELHRVHEEVRDNLNIYGFSQYWATYYSLDMAPAYMLNPSDFFKLAITKLPSTYTGSSEAQNMYQEFVQAYGTHYVCYGAFGGSAHLDEFLNKSYTSQYSLQQVSTQMGLSFHFYFFDISPGSFHNRSQINTDKWFDQAVAAYSFFKGGDPAYQTNTTVHQWLESVPDYAGLLNTTLCPLTDLITWDTTRQASINDFINNVYMREPVNAQRVLPARKREW